MYAADIALVPAVAATVHKSRESKSPAPAIPVLTQDDAMLKRNLLYTGVTRGKRLVVPVCRKKAVAIAVRNASEGWGVRSWTDGWSAGRPVRKPVSPAMPGLFGNGR